ncbi:EXOC5 [Mytilus coruscus]|uniref:EXOC5 n=1 Tax=Mytilus coruscus TaxID=42192 RepID=A0A6J8CMM5_MYTCO|nr:EXOC5 [Mytilus coruscus]
MLCTHSDLAGNAEKILCVLIQYLVLEHTDYAVELGLQAIPLPDPKNQPEIYFFDVVGQANTLFHLFEKQDSLIPLVLLCIQKRRVLREQLKGKIDIGLDRAVATVAGWIRNILSAEQKKTDFKPEDDSVLGQMVTPVNGKNVEVVLTELGTRLHRVIFDHLQQFQYNSLDGKNVEVVLTELGTRLHRVIFDHLQQFQYNSLDGKNVEVVLTELGTRLHRVIFDHLQQFQYNSLVVVPDNLKQVCSGEQLVHEDLGQAHDHYCIVGGVGVDSIAVNAVLLIRSEKDRLSGISSIQVLQVKIMCVGSLLCNHSDLAGNAEKIICVLIQYLVLEHIDYAVELEFQVVEPDNLKQVCSGEQLVGLDKSVLMGFIQLRYDYRTAKLATVLK